MLGFVALQIGLVARAYASPHREFGYQMFPEASTWRADVVRVTDDGQRVPITEPWFGYRWNDLVRGRGLASPWNEHLADAGVDNQLAFLAEALDWVAGNTPDDTETRYLEATVASRRNADEIVMSTMRSDDRDLDQDAPP